MIFCHSSGKGLKLMVKKYSVPALEKAIAIIELLNESDQGLTVTEIHTQLGLPKATVFMILSVLEEHNIAKKNTYGQYSLGPRIYTLGMSYMTKLDLRKISRPHMEKLSKETGFTSHLGIMVDDYLLFVDKVEIQSFIKFNTFPGMRTALHVTSMGKAILAFHKDEEINELVERLELGRYTPNTITDKEKFKQALKRIRETGYAIEDEEGEVGVRCIGAPIFNIDGKVIAAVSVTALKPDLQVDSFQEVGNKVMEAARNISSEMGYQTVSRGAD
jgi:DNA-binding IclR family transcriptional regulator